MIAALLLQAVSANAMPAGVWAQISTDTALDRTSTTVDFMFDTQDWRDDQFTLRLTARRPEEPAREMWASSRTCSAVRQAVFALKHVPYPEVELPGDMSSIVMDGTGYVVRFTARYGQQQGAPLKLSSNVNTPLAQWVDQTLTVLQPCWRSTRQDATAAP